MKKYICTVFILILFLSGCSAEIPTIEQYTWIMWGIQSREENGAVIAYGERGNDSNPSAVKIELKCTAHNGIITLTDNTNSQSYTGTYSLSHVDPRASNYEVTIDGKSGLAVTALTTYLDKSKDPTLIINLGEYNLNFFAQSHKKENVS